MPATVSWPIAATSGLRSAGRTCGATSTNSPPGPAPIASEALEHSAALYAVEKDVRGRGADERRTFRQQKSRPLVGALEPWLRAKLGLICQKSKLAEAIRYALSRWEA
jgi:transposase